MKLTIEKIVYGGLGLARIPAEVAVHGGMRVFVPFTLPDEIVEVEIVEEHRGYRVAEAREILRPSKFRTAPPCPWFGRCGGCQLQHSDYLCQVELKREMLAESLTRARLRDLPEITALTGNPLGYRNRIRLHVQAHPEFSIGYRQAKSHHMLAIDSCSIASPLLERCLVTLRALGQQGMVPPDIREVELFANQDESELLMTLWAQQGGRSHPDIYEKFLENIQKTIPALTGASMWAIEKDRPRSSKPQLQWGASHLLYRVAGRMYTVRAGSFFQANRGLLDSFVTAVVGSEAGPCAWDLYAGVGLFSLAMAERFSRVVAVESSLSASKDLHKNLQSTQATALTSATLQFLRQAVQQITERREPAPDLVVLDPPRTGAGVEACNLLARCNPHRIVYVSCDPATLGRDLATLIQSGYRLERLQLVDMFPQTHHLETIATLQR